MKTRKQCVEAVMTERQMEIYLVIEESCNQEEGS